MSDQNINSSVPGSPPSWTPSQAIPLGHYGSWPHRPSPYPYPMPVEGHPVRTIKIKYLSNKIDKLEYVGGHKSDWIDLRTAEHIQFKAGEFKLIPLGVAMHLPEGYEALVIPRSSTFKNYGLIQANSIGVIDETYCGDNDEWHWPIYATRDIFIAANTRICQFRIIKHQPQIIFLEQEHLGNNDRGGFGSTGHK